MMGKPLATLLVIAGLALLAVVVLAVSRCNAASPASPASPVQRLHESSVGGVIVASKLPGKIGQGFLVYNKWCSGCHAADFEPAGGNAGGDKLSPVSRTPLGTNLLRQRYQGSVPAVLEDRTDLTPDSVNYFVRTGVNAMPAFRKTEISDSELEALSAYLTRNSKSDPAK